MLLTLDELKNYLRLDIEDDEDDNFLTSLLIAAEEYIYEATGQRYGIEVPERVKLVVRLLVSHWYDNRTIISNQSVNRIDFSVRALLMQLRYMDGGS